ncbi:response regulator [Herbivorax sp. ANBcel31]|uniref:GGDEF domain-containing response regulator n=1 Tax=Herbivorax sp. ANBcel31 TaxID=3069754 RepID=UPI0027B82D51|nr:response regulator [Herbivorax sp. ANBcel31]MDQ2085395.1 response regulator [Herbivorax sp. ANBcel31]
MFKKKILIIEDTGFMRKLISDILIDSDYDVVTASTGPQGIQRVREEKPDLVLLDVVMPGMDGFEVCKVLREDESNNLMPIIMLTAQENEDDKLEGLEIGADDYIIKPFNSRELVSRVRNTLKRIDRNRWANPLTGLRGNIEIQTEINQRIATSKMFAVIYCDLDNFKAYNDVYGFASGDRVIKLTADVLIDCTHTHGNSSDFIGHIGGDDFVIITTPDKVDVISKNIIRDLDIKIKELYCKEDVDRGYIVTSNRQGQIMKFPIVSISLSVVTNEERELISHVQIAEIAAELKKKAKSMPGSVYVKDRRKG